MSYSGDAAEQVVRMSLETGEVAVRLAGSGAKQLAILLYAILREQKKTAGKARLTNMLRSGKELKVFAVKDSDLQLFCREAKKYGVLYCVLKDRDATDGLTDIMARAEDASPSPPPHGTGRLILRPPLLRPLRENSRNRYAEASRAGVCIWQVFFGKRTNFLFYFLCFVELRFFCARCTIPSHFTGGKLPFPAAATVVWPFSGFLYSRKRPRTRAYQNPNC